MRWTNGKSTQQEFYPTIHSQGDPLAIMELLPVESLVYTATMKIQAHDISDGVQESLVKYGKNNNNILLWSNWNMICMLCLNKYLGFTYNPCTI